MQRKLKNNAAIPGLIYTVGLAVFCIVLALIFFTEQRLSDYLFDIGVDSVGALISAALFFGLMKQTGTGIGTLRILIVLVSSCFAVNGLVYFTVGVPSLSTLCFTFCLVSKLLDLVMIYFFYAYVKVTLGFEGMIAKLADKLIPILMAFETLVILSNIFYPTTFYLDADFMYQSTPFSLSEDICLIAASALAAILIIRSHNPRNQKAAAMTFILFPLIEYILMKRTFGNAAQYAMVLMSLIIMYCVIFIEKSKELAATRADLGIASKIQADALPPVAPAFEGFSKIILRGSMTTAREVGGDFYDYFVIDENRICFLIADVSGKGIPAALFMMTAKTMIKDYALTMDTTSEIFTKVNERLCDNNDEGMFATAWIGILDTATMKLQYTNAGHNYPILQRKDRPCEEMEKEHGLFLGGLDFTIYEQDEIELKPGDRLLLYTDGITEAHNRANALYGTERLEKIMESTKDMPGEKALESILSDIEAFEDGAPRFDDITMVILTIIGEEQSGNDERLL